MVATYNINSPLNRQERTNLNDSLNDAQSRLVSLQRQINTLSGGNEIEKILERIEETVNNGNASIAEIQAVIDSGNQYLSSFEQAETNIEGVINNANQSVTNNIRTVDELVVRTEAELSGVVNSTNEQIQVITNNVDQLAADLAGYNIPITNFDLSTAYIVNQAVRYNGTTYRAKVATQNNPLPTSSQVENTWWTLEAQRGVDGNGAVSSVAGILPTLDGDVNITPEDINALGQQHLTDIDNRHIKVISNSQPDITSNEIFFQQTGATPDTPARPTYDAVLESVNSLYTNANSDYVLPILNPYSTYENIHPKVLHFPGGLWGYAFWMAYTPYTRGMVQEENPCLAVSNDGVNWITPPGVTNPLAPWSGDIKIYNSDTDLVYRADTNTLEIWWREANETANLATLKRRTTTNGRTFTAAEVTLTSPMGNFDFLSPSIIFEDNKYKMWSAEGGSVSELRYIESATGIFGNNPPATRITNFTVHPWHLDVIKVGDEYQFWVQERNNIGSNGNNFSSLYFVTSKDLLTYSEPVLVISPSLNGWDNQGIYRSSPVLVGDLYYLYYSAVSKTAHRGIGLSIGKVPSLLNGLKLSTQNGIDFANPSGRTVKVQAGDVTNVLEVKQGQDSSRYGGIKASSLILKNSVTNSITAEEGIFRYDDQSTKVPQIYTGSNYSPTTVVSVYAETNNEQLIFSGTPKDVVFDRVVLNESQKYDAATGIYTSLSAGRYKFSIGLQLQNVGADEKVELLLVDADTNTNARRLFLQRINPDEAGLYTINVEGVRTVTAAGIRTKIVLNYTGSSTTARITRFSWQNSLQIERF